MLASGPGSAVEVVVDEDASAPGPLGAGVPDMGETDSGALGAVARPSGSAECWRFNCAMLESAMPG